RDVGESEGKCDVGIEASICGGGARWEWEDKAGDRGFLHDRLSWFGHTWLVPTAEQVVAVTNFESRVHRIRKSRTSGSAARRYRLSEQPHFQSRSNVSDRCGRPDRVVPSGRADWSGPGREGVGCGSAAPSPSSFDSREIR